MEKKSIKDLRKEKNLSQEKLARLSGVTTATINRAEKTGKIRLETYLKIINALQ